MQERIRKILRQYRDGLLTEGELMICILTVCPSIEALVDVSLAFNAEDQANTQALLASTAAALLSL